MPTIDELCNDRVPKYYAAVLTENAAVPLRVGGFGIEGVATAEREFVGYNVCRDDEYTAMMQDPLVPDSLKQEIRNQTSVGKEDDLSKVEGWHVIRTKKPASGGQFKDLLDALEMVYNSNFFSKKERGVVSFRDRLVAEKLYSVGTEGELLGKLLIYDIPNEQLPVTKLAVSDRYKVLMEVEGDLSRYCEQLFSLGQEYGAIANPVLTGPTLAIGETQTDYYVLGRDNTEARAKADGLAEALRKLPFVKSAHVQNYDQRN